MKLPELKELAKQMGLRGTSTMRKPDLLATLQAARSGGQAPEGVTVRAPKTTAKPAKTESSAAAAQPERTDAPAQTTPVETTAPAEPVIDLPLPADKPATVKETSDEEQPLRKIRRNRADSIKQAIAADQPAIELPAETRPRRQRRDEEAAGAALLGDLGLPPTGDRAERRRKPLDDDRQRRRRDMDGEDGQMRRRRRMDQPSDDVVRDLDDILATLPDQREPKRDTAGDEPMEREFTRRSRNRADRAERNAERAERAGRDERNERGDRTERTDRHQRRMRGRDRDFDERNDRTERTMRDDRADRGERMERDERPARDMRREEQDDVVTIAGIVDVLDSYAFVRTSGYLPGPNDVYVSMGQVKKYGLRKGDAVQGTIRTPREGDRRNQRQKFVPLQSIDTINGMSVEEAADRPQFSKLTPLYPQERLKQETTANKLTGRIMDIVAPIGKGQRGLIVSPPKAGKTITLQNIANAIATNNPEVHLMVVLVDERPEEVTDMQRTVQGEVIASTFDRPASDHTTVAELAIERAKRLVELGQDVVVLLDSMTRLARAYNIAAPASGRILSGGVDAQALYPPKKFFGAARNIENGGSLTIISSALVETGSKMDEVIFEEFKGTGNMELKLSRELADKRLFPAIDINASGTRREELITNPQELPIIYRLRRLFGGMEPEQAYQTLVPRLKKAPTNRDFLAAIVQQQGGGAVNGN
ncbi:transcription termination factor Rho [Bifidobacterium samirii]|uniref:Transcription termination factor Rho n=2 Tax=Bifidobacterium samirii TaxID=2306974 RepID=A0A430FW58_9BIFI|nr:transcription termination factor Rho [Bifidobacterium samirii]